MILEKYERTVCFLETTEKEVYTLKGIESIDVDSNPVVIRKKNGQVLFFEKTELVSIWCRNETCYDFTKEVKEGGEA